MIGRGRHGLGFGRLLPVLLLAPLITCQGGCTSVAVSAGATVATAAAEERGVTGAAKDFAVATAVTALWIENDPSLVKDLDVTVSEGRAMLTGTVTTQARRLEAVQLAWRAAGVKAVLNEIEVRSPEGFTGYARDSWITAQMVSRLSLDRDVAAINYTVDTVNRVIYLMGIAQDRAEIDRVMAHARRIPYVRRVVSHVRLKGEPPQRPGRGPAPETGQQR